MLALPGTMCDTRVLWEELTLDLLFPGVLPSGQALVTMRSGPSLQTWAKGSSLCLCTWPRWTVKELDTGRPREAHSSGPVRASLPVPM